MPTGEELDSYFGLKSIIDSLLFREKRLPVKEAIQLEYCIKACNQDVNFATFPPLKSIIHLYDKEDITPKMIREALDELGATAQRERPPQHPHTSIFM